MDDQHIILNSRSYPLAFAMLAPEALSYSPENPRFFDSLNPPDGPLQQSDIYDLLSKSDEVRQLKTSILENGGVIEPLYVFRDSHIVIEGNCRLAAMQMLSRENPELWSSIPCWLLPDDLPQDAVFALLGQHHITGRRDWGEFEQAHYLYRRVTQTGIPARTIALQLGIPPKRADKFIKTIEFMEKNGDVSQKHWKCYSQYIGDASVKKVRQEEPRLDQTIAEAIKSESIKDNKDIKKLRDTARVAAKGDEDASSVIRNIAEGSLDVRQGYKKIDNSGKFDDVLAKLQKFLSDINRLGFEHKIAEYTDSADLIRGELDSIINRLQQFRDSLNTDTSQ